jgi:hypothetical protein
MAKSWAHCHISALRSAIGEDAPGASNQRKFASARYTSPGISRMGEASGRDEVGAAGWQIHGLKMARALARRDTARAAKQTSRNL